MPSKIYAATQTNGSIALAKYKRQQGQLTDQSLWLQGESPVPRALVDVVFE